MSDDNALGLVNKINSELDKATAKADKLVKALSGGASNGGSGGVGGGGNVMSGSLANISSLAVTGLRQEAAATIVSGVTKMANGGMAMMPDVAQTMQRAGTYYQGAVISGGMMGTTRLGNIMRGYLGTGFSNPQSGAETAAALAGQYIMPGTARFRDVSVAAGNATKYLNMDTASAASAFAGLTSGQGSANFMRRYGMFTSDPRTGKPLGQDQIFNQLKSRFIRQKLSTSETMDELNRGFLGSNIRNSGMTQDQQFLFAQKLIEESKGKSFNYSDPNSVKEALARNKAAGIENPFTPAQELNATKDQAMQDAQGQYLQGIKDATAALKQLTKIGGQLASTFAGRANSFGQTLFGQGSPASGAVDFLSGLGTAAIGTYAAIKAPKIIAKVLGKGTATAAGKVAEKAGTTAATTAAKAGGKAAAGGAGTIRSSVRAAKDYRAAKAAGQGVKSSAPKGSAAYKAGMKNAESLVPKASKDIWGIGKEGLLKTGAKALKAGGVTSVLGGGLGYAMGDDNPWDDWESAAFGAAFGGIAGAGVFSLPGALIGGAIGYLGNAAGYYATKFADENWWGGNVKKSVSGALGTGGPANLLGMGSTTDTTGGQALIKPVEGGTITAHYGEKGSIWAKGWHSGTDYAVPIGTTIYAAADGKVSSAQKGNGSHSYGLYIVLDHGNGYETLYGHLSATIAKPGDVVKQGQPIAKSGDSGHVTGPHLHFEVFLNGVAVDPGTLKSGALSGGDGKTTDKGKSAKQLGKGTTPNVLDIVMNGTTGAQSPVSTSMSGVVGNYQSALEMVGRAMGGGQTAVYSPVTSATGMLSSQVSNSTSGAGGPASSIGLGKTSNVAQGAPDAGELTSVGGRINRGTGVKPQVNISVNVARATELEARNLAEMVKRYLEEDELVSNMARR